MDLDKQQPSSIPKLAQGETELSTPLEADESAPSGPGSDGEIESGFDHPGEPELTGAPHSAAPNSAAPNSAAPNSAAPNSLSLIPFSERPSFWFFGVLTAVSLAADISTKVWAEVVVNQRGLEPIKIVGENLSITLAYNPGGAWGLFAGAQEMIRKPFFLGVSAFAIYFIISIYSRLHPTQKALKWGLPLVLGGALGNLSDRITRSQVIDFIDYRADWVMSFNSFIHRFVKSWTLTDHWPTFNVADVGICVGVGLMAVDMFTHRARPAVPAPSGAAPEPSQLGEQEETLDAPDGSALPSERAVP